MNKLNIDLLKQSRIIFFDSKCILCNSYARFIYKHDKTNKFLLSGINGETYKQLNIEKMAPQLDSIIFFDCGIVTYKTLAVIQIGKGLGGLAKFCAILLSFIPIFISNIFYDLIAKYRYKIFGKTDYCGLLSEEEKKKVLP
ncbi:MAG: DUF393 domain-containing protein [Bacteriovoracaceae bacterium]|jgi:predicted DCC family thiol-disulfide oxidoreductase YuxK|nr:DUF393 domain-containing protein [Bacteriovoracaceae bacterium]